MTARGMWRWADRLPVAREHAVSLGEGDTPLVDVSATLGADLGLGALLLKAEDRNPTGSFKARIASVAASIVRERGLAGLVGTSSGNGGAAAAAYARAGGSAAVLFTLSDTVPMKLLEITAVGGRAYRVDGVGHDARSTRAVADLIAGEAARLGYYPMLTGFHYAPDAMAGVQTIAYELVEERPDAGAVYAPVGGGGLLTGLHRGYQREHEATGAPVPRLVGVHPTGASALAAALAGAGEGMDGPVTTTVSGLQMATLYDTDGATRAVRESDGHARAVDDEQIRAAQRLLASRCGLLVEPAGAASVAGVVEDARTGVLGPADRVVAVLTGAGYKDAVALSRLAPAGAPPLLGADQVGAVLESLGALTRG